MISSKITFSFDENGFDFYRLFIFTLLKKKTTLFQIFLKIRKVVRIINSIPRYQYS